MRIFGGQWGMTPLPEVSVPWGQPCMHCDEPIQKDDRGVLVPFLLENGLEEKPLHRECYLRSIFGSVGHQLGKCGCNGGTMDDPPGMTRHQAAIAAVNLFEQTRAATQPPAEA